MISNLWRTAAIAAALAAAPALAQMSPPPPPGPGPMMGGPGGPGGPGMHHGMMGQRMFGAMSEAGRQTLMDAMRAAGDRKAGHEEVKAARERMLAVLDADRLDTGALKRAMDDEQRAVDASRDRMQAAMLAGFTKLSVADRKAFVADARSMKARMEARMDDWRKNRGRHGGDDTPPPPPQMP